MEMDPATVSLTAGLVIGFLGGLTVPTYFAIERLSGFGRWAVSQVPYEPPPGKSEDEAMEEVSRDGDDN